MKHPGSLGNGQGRAVERALDATEKAVEHIAEVKTVMERMNDKQRKLFVALSRGKDELEAALEAGYTEWFTGIVKILDLKEEYRTKTKQVMKTSDLSKSNLHAITEQSYERLLSICQNRVEKQTDGVSYKDHITSINDFLALIAPDAYAVIGDIMLDETIKPEVRLKAADSLLDRAGYKEKTGESRRDNPVMVNIIMPTVAEAEVIE
jgi:hypothetical protein